jgi:two-component system sensor histidine kinase/response regulator
MPYRVLIVDDYPLNRMLFFELFDMAGQTAEVAENGLEAVDKIKQGTRYDAVLMDINMPVLDGIAATRAIRLLPGGDSLLIIGIGGDDEQKIEACSSSGMNIVVGKPFNPEDIIRLIDAHMGKPNSEKTSKADIPFQKANGNSSMGMPLDVFDFAKAVSDFQGDADLVRAVLKEFLQELRNHGALVKMLLAAGDFKALKQEAHKVKGGALNICAARLAQAAKDVETHSLDTSHESVEKAVADFLAEAETFAGAAKSKLM